MKNTLSLIKLLQCSALFAFCCCFTAWGQEDLAADTGTSEEIESVEEFEGLDEAMVEDTIEIGQEDAEHPGIEEQEIDDNDLITVTLNEVPVSDAIRMFARLAGANVIMGREYEDTISVSLVDVPWEPALREILTSVGLMLVERTPGIFTVTSFREVNAEPMSVDSIFLKFNTVENVLPVVQGMLVSSNASASAFSDANAIIVRESPTRIKDIKTFIEKIDLPRPQVFIETKFVELNDEAIKDLGINWQVLENYTVTSSGMNRTFREVNNRMEQDTEIFQVTEDNGLLNERGATGSTTDNVAGLASDRALDGAEGTIGDTRTTANNRGTTRNSSRTSNDRVSNILVQGKNFERIEDGIIGIPEGDDVPFRRQEIMSSVLSADDFALTLSALKQNNGIEIVSNPKVVVASGQEASIHVGRNEPNVIAVPVGDNGDRFFFQLDSENPFIEIGVKLKVTPTVNTRSNITVKITPELSRKLEDRIFGEGATQVSFPVTQIREIQTEFNIESGKTVAIGGLTTTEDVENIRKVPLLGDIPIIGKYLFTHTHTEQRQDEIIVFVTVSMAEPERVTESMGIPMRAELVHRQMMQEALEIKDFQKKLKEEREAFEAKLESAEVLEELESADATQVERIQPDFLINKPPVIELPSPVLGTAENESSDAAVEEVEMIEEEVDYSTPVQF